MRILALFSLSTGALLAHATGNLKQGELALWRQLWQELKPGDLILGDRNFSGYAYLGMLLGQGVDSVVRKNSKRTTGSRVLAQLGDNDFLVEWKKTGQCPDWMSEEEWGQMPGTLILREIVVKVEQAGFRPDTIHIVTTLLEAEKYPTHAFGELFLRRWRVEVFFGALKTTLGMDVLRTRSAKMVRKELLMHLLAYNLTRGLMAAGAKVSEVDPGELSFKKSLNLVRTWSPVMAGLEEEKRAEMEEMLLGYLSRAYVKIRPGRSEPRAKKRRPKNYPLLTAPRSEYTEIPHRNRYTKTKKKA